MSTEINKPLVVGPAPHIHSKNSISLVMNEVMLALIPAVLAALYFFKWNALIVICASVASAVMTEYLWCRFAKLPVRINDSSAALTGLLLAMTLPPTLPWWMVIIGSVFAVIIGKQVFGGLGHNPFNPALAGRAFLQISWPQEMTSWVTPFDAVTTATPLAIKKMKIIEDIPSYFDMLIGNRPGCLGETSVLALIVGGIYLYKRGHITLTIPILYIGTVALGAFAFGENALFHVLSGGLMLGAIYMATDPVTSPISTTGKVLFAIGCGTLTILIRIKGGFPEAVCFSILIMNMIVPLIDRYTIPKRFGAVG